MDEFQLHAVYIARLCGSSHIPFNDSFWLELIRYRGSLASICPRTLLSFLHPYAVQLTHCNSETGHYAQFMMHVVDQLGLASTSRASTEDIMFACNALTLLRALTASILSLVPSAKHQEFLLASPKQEVSMDVLWQLVSACLTYVEEVEVSAARYSLCYAVISLLITFCCSQLYTGDTGTPGSSSRSSCNSLSPHIAIGHVTPNYFSVLCHTY
jgi:hypothetical protein